MWISKARHKIVEVRMQVNTQAKCLKLSAIFHKDMQGSTICRLLSLQQQHHVFNNSGENKPYDSGTLSYSDAQERHKRGTRDRDTRDRGSINRRTTRLQTTRRVSGETRRVRKPLTKWSGRSVCICSEQLHEQQLQRFLESRTVRSVSLQRYLCCTLLA
jgi:hypothetical protein